MDDHFVGYEAGFTVRRHAAEARFAGKWPMGQPIAGDCIEGWAPARKRIVRECMALPQACRTMFQTMRMLLDRHRTKRVGSRMTARCQTGVRSAGSAQPRRRHGPHGSGL